MGQTNISSEGLKTLEPRNIGTDGNDLSIVEAELAMSRFDYLGGSPVHIR
jgi:hypothetical protein